MPTNTPSSMSTTTDRIARRLTAMSVSGRMLQYEYRVPGAFYRQPPEQHVDGYRQCRDQSDRQQRQRARQCANVRQQPGLEGRWVHAGQCAQLQATLLEQIDVGAAMARPK